MTRDDVAELRKLVAEAHATAQGPTEYKLCALLSRMLDMLRPVPQGTEPAPKKEALSPRRRK